MIHTSRCSLVVLIALILCSLARTQTHRGGERTEEVSFTAEDATVQKPVTIPAEVLAILGEDKTVRSVAENENVSSGSLPTEWFEASVVHLTAAKTNDLIVMGQPPVSGGNVALFWIFRRCKGQYDLALFAPTHTLKIKNSYSIGYRDIELIASTAKEVTVSRCRFNGSRYTCKGKTKPIG